MRHFLKYGLPLISLLAVSWPITVTSIARAEDNAGEIQAIVDKFSTEFQAARAAKDTERLANLYANNATVMPPGETVPTKGHDAIRELFDRLIKTPQQPLSLAIDDLRSPAPNVIFVSGTWTEKESSGMYLYVLEKGGNEEWKTQTMIWNQR